MNRYEQNLIKKDGDLLSQMVSLFKEDINKFYTLFVYEIKNVNGLEIEKMLELDIEEFDSTAFIANFEAYVLTEESYRANIGLYATIRKQAREKVTMSFIRVAILYCLKKYMDFTELSMIDKVKIENLYEQVEAVMLGKVKLNYVSSWKEFNSWYRDCLKEKVIEELILTVGLNQLQQLSKEKLNELFIRTLNDDLINNKRFLNRMKNEIHLHYGEFGTLMLNEVSVLVKKHLQKRKVLDSTRNVVGKDFSKVTAVPNYISVVNFVVYQAIREAIYQKNFEIHPNNWPIYRFSKGKTVGTIEIIPVGLQTVETFKEAEDILQQFSTIDVDVLDILCALYIYQAQQPKGLVEVEISDILKMRGLREKLGGEGRRGGFEKKQKDQIIQALKNIQSLWVKIEQTTVYKQNKLTQTNMQGRIFSFKTCKGEEYIVNENTSSDKIMYTIDALFDQYSNVSQKQLALLPIACLQYHAYRMSAEKKLSRYLSWRWRTQAFKGNYLQPNKVRTILNAMGEKMNERAPMRTRERFEKALDTLAQDGIIAAWHYINWDEEVASVKGWKKYWLNTSIIIEPPDQVKEHYLSIEKNNRSEKVKAPNVKEEKSLGNLVLKRRKELNMTILQLAEILEISAPYVSNIEKNSIVPSTRLRNKIVKWLETSE